MQLDGYCYTILDEEDIPHDKKYVEQEGVKIYENSQVKNIEEGREIRLTVGDHTVQTKAVVIATNGYTSKLGYFKHQVMPVHAQCAVTPPLGQKLLTKLGWKSRLPFFDSRNFLYHLVLTADNGLTANCFVPHKTAESGK
ncbi:MAG: FAD-dependent oxidoreductase [Thermodesulfobacteriota bacterium]